MLRILVVDDCLDTDKCWQLLLQSWGHETRVAVNGSTALDIADNFHPDVVILDLAMPGMDGYEVAKCLREIDQQKPIIIANSGYCAEADVRHSLEVGCNYHLSKPVEPDEVKRLLECCEHKTPT